MTAKNESILGERRFRNYDDSQPGNSLALFLWEAMPVFHFAGHWLCNQRCNTGESFRGVSAHEAYVVYERALCAMVAQSTPQIETKVWMQPADKPHDQSRKCNFGFKFQACFACLVIYSRHKTRENGKCKETLLFVAVLVENCTYDVRVAANRRSTIFYASVVTSGGAFENYRSGVTSIGWGRL